MFKSFKDIKGTARQILIARVKKIVLGPKLTDNQIDPDYKCEKDLGAIRYELLYTGKSNVRGTNNTSKLAYPIFSFMRQYPVIGEIVILISGPSVDLNDSQSNQDLYYFPPYSTFNSPHINAFPNMQEYAEYIKQQLADTNNNLQDLEYFKLPVGATFNEKSDQVVKSLRPFEGDIILQARWGQSIRFGSTVPGLKSINPWSQNTSIVDVNQTSGDPITIIVNSQKKYITNIEKDSPFTVEDINRDGSSIYLTSTQAVTLNDITNFEIRSWNVAAAVDRSKDTVITPEQIPITNEFISAADQDQKSVQSQTNV